MNMNLRDVQYFAVVAEHRHLGRAAESLGLSQPALSMSLRRLERFMQTKLVKRTPKGVDLTVSGEAVFAHARRLRLSVEDISREVADLSHGRAGHIRIGASARLAVELVPSACAVLLNESPRVTLKIMQIEADTGVTALVRGELDLYATGNPLTGHDDLVQELLFEEEWAAFVSEHHRLARKKHLTLADLAQERWVLGYSGPAQGHLLRAFAQRGLPAPRIVAEVNSMLIRRQLVPSTDLLTFGPRQFFQEGVSRSRLVELRVKDLSSRRSLGVVHRKDAYLSPAARRFIEILKATAKEISAEKP